MDRRRQLAVVALVYVIEGFPMGVFQHVLSVYFRRHGAALAEIGLLSALGYAWMLKALWSPLVERIGTRQDWIRGALVVMAMSLATVALLPASPIGPALVAALAAYCLASATQDIAIDGYTIGLVERGREGPGERSAHDRLSRRARDLGQRHVARRGLARLALRPSSPRRALSAAFAASLSWTPAIALPPAAERRPLHSLRTWLVRPGVVPVLAFVILFRIGDRAMGPMLPTFWVDRGFSDAELALAREPGGRRRDDRGCDRGRRVGRARRDRSRALGHRSARARLEPRLRGRRGVAREWTHRCLRGVAVRGRQQRRRSAPRSSRT
jgi:PAT family beta-lactamase induction signal transducer AmpG